MGSSEYNGLRGGQRNNFAHAQAMHPNMQPNLLNHSKRHESMDQMKTVQNLEKTQEEMWHEFKNHFRDPNRERGKVVNHHDFLDASFLPKVGKSHSRRTFFSQVGGLSMDKHPFGVDEHESAVNLGRERLQ